MAYGVEKHADQGTVTTLEHRFANSAARLQELEELLATEQQRASGMIRLVVQYLRTVQGTPFEYNRRLEHAERLHAYSVLHASASAAKGGYGKSDLRTAIAGLEEQLTELSRHTGGLYQLMEHLKEQAPRQYAEFTNEHKAMIGALVHQLSVLSERIDSDLAANTGTYVR